MSGDMAVALPTRLLSLTWQVGHGTKTPPFREWRYPPTTNQSEPDSKEPLYPSHDRQLHASPTGTRRMRSDHHVTDKCSSVQSAGLNGRPAVENLHLNMRRACGLLPRV